MGNSPCYGCGDRHINCHSTCDTYIEWKRGVDKENEIIRRNKEKYKMLDHMEEYRLRKN